MRISIFTRALYRAGSLAGFSAWRCFAFIPAWAVLCGAIFVSPVLAEEIIEYPGGGRIDTDPLFFAPGSLMPQSSLSENTMNIADDVVGNAFGGVSGADGEVRGNTVTIRDGAIGGSAYGGASDTGNVERNSITITSGRVVTDLVGGYSESGNVSGNTATVSGGSVDERVYGGVAPLGIAADNRANINGGTVTGDVHGGSGDSGATGNITTINGGSVVGDVFGGSSQAGNARGNTVLVNAGSLARDVNGGWSDTGDAEGNTVTFNGGSVAGSVFGGLSQSGTARGNMVTVNDGTLEFDVVGGSSFSGDATGNTVVIRGGSITGDVIGGLSNGNATGNTVTISGAPSLATSWITGGFSIDESSDFFSGNTLNIMEYRGTVARIRNFENLNFLVPASMRPGEVMLTVTEEVDLTGSGDRGSVVGVRLADGGPVLAPGDYYVLVESNLVLSNAALNPTAQARKGAFLLYDFDIAASDVALTATVSRVRVNQQTKALNEGRVAGMAFVLQGADLVASSGMHAALAATSGSGAAFTIAPFGVVSGGSSRYKTNSHVDVDGVSLLAGIAGNLSLAPGTLLGGVFFEAGWGNYDSHNSFSTAASVDGSGDIRYHGGGLFARYTQTAGMLRGAYAEASGRAGRAHTEFSSGDLRDASGRKAEYDSGSAYHGAHAGLGYLLDLNERAALDIYAKYLWTRMDSDSVSVAGDPVRFDSSESHRLRGGVRLNLAVTEQITPYFGAAYEYEFDGKATGTTYGYSMPSTSLEGGTGIGEAGVIVTPVADSGFSLDLGVQGHVGTREGVTGRLQLRWEF